MANLENIASVQAKNSRFFMDGGEIHIGRIIQAKLKEQGRSVAWLARQIPCTRGHLYKIFAKPDINTSLLQRISQAMDYYFFKHYE